MSNKLISVMIMVVIGVALLPVIVGFTEDVNEGTEYEESFTQESYAVDTDYDLDFDATEDNLSETDITVDGTLVVENGEPVEDNDTFEYTDGVYTFTYVTSSDETLEIDTDTDTLNLSGTWSETGDVELTYLEYNEPSSAVQGLVSLLPTLYVIVMISGTVVYIKK